MTFQVLLFTLAAIGISETVYLIKKRWSSQKPVCPLGENCAKVLDSQYNKIFLIHNDVVGLVFYVTIAFMTALLVIGVEPVFWWENLAKVLIGVGALFSGFLTFLQWRVIEAWCFWCLMSVATVWAMAGIVIVADLTLMGF